MNKRMLSILSLLLTINFMNGGDVQEQYMNHYIEAIENSLTANKAVEKALQKLMLTGRRKSRLYKVSRKQWRKCLLNYSDNDCESLKESLEEALQNLKETPKYAEFGTLFKDAAYYNNLRTGLSKIVRIDATYSLDKGWTKEQREEKLHDAINSNTLGEYADASDTDLELAEDVHEDEQRAQDELHSIVNEIEANNQ